MEEKKLTYKEWNERHKRKQARRAVLMEKYFLRQLLVGIGLLLFGVIIAVIANLIGWMSLAAVGAIITVASIYVMFTKKMLLVNDLYFRITEGNY